MEEAKKDGDTNAYEVQLKVVLIMTTSHFTNPGLLDDKRMDHAMEAGRRSLQSSQKLAAVRLAFGLSRVMWLDFTRLFVKAIPALERQSFAPNDSIDSDPIGLSSSLITNNFIPLLKNVERINDLCIIARNMLATRCEAQDLAANIKFDQLILRLIDLCIRVTARGYDGEAGTRAEEKWQRVINAYKKLLITCLQFLHNFVMNNERRKLLLWMDLFGSSPCADPSFMSRVDPAAYFKSGDCAAGDDLDGNRRDDTDETSRSVPRSSVPPLGRALSDDKSKTSLSLEMESALRAKMKTVNLNEDHIDSPITTSPEAAPKVKERAVSAPPYPAALDSKITPDFDQNMAIIRRNKVKESVRSPSHPGESFERGNGSVNVPPDLNGRPVVSPLLVASNFTGLDGGTPARPEDDTLMYIGPSAAAQILQLSKTQMIDRLHDRLELPVEGQECQIYDDGMEGSEGHNQMSEQDNDNSSEHHANESIEDDEDSYQGPGDQDRGLLTDIPLVLGPNEIEALPMIIQTGIVDSFATKPPEGIHENMQAIRANVLIAQESGRNLLRELLIFIAAWDLADDEVYFKMMMQIMEALLINGLIPCTYGWFQESGPYNHPRLPWAPPNANRWKFNRAKDIISPSQAVMIKLLTQIFRAKQSRASGPARSSPSPSSTAVPLNVSPSPAIGPPHNIPRVDIFVVRYIFGQFRLTVIPGTCALIFLQGQIHAGKVDPEDFPLNLWDMERVYEGVYQFLEFFAVLTEAEDWKNLLVEWEITHELVALLRELHAGIPRATLTTTTSPANVPSVSAHPAAPASPQPPPPLSTQTPVAVERPYDPHPPPSHSPPPPLHSTTSATQPPPMLTTEDPSTFTWRNLKKLVVLVLSSLVWKSPTVQDQVRSHGGVEMVLSCCCYDGNNPYIREHAIMCLRFLLEGNAGNQKLVRELEAREAVPSEVLERGGWETFVDGEGGVGLRRVGTVAQAKTNNAGDDTESPAVR